MIRVFRHYIPRWLLLLWLSEFFHLVVASYVGFFIYCRYIGASSPDPSQMLAGAVAYGVVMLLAMSSMGMYQRGLRDSIFGLQLRLLLSAAVCMLAMPLLAVVAPEVFPEARVILAALVVSLLSIAAYRLTFDLAIQHAPMRSRILVVGMGPHAARLLKLRRRTDWRGQYLVGFVPVAGQDAAFATRRLIADDRPLRQLCREHRVDELLLAVEPGQPGPAPDEVQACEAMGVRVIDSVSFFEHRTGRIMLDARYLDGTWTSPDRTPRLRRVLDVAGGLTLGLLALPVMLLAALAVRLSSPGPVLFRQRRVGVHGEPFVMWKFRSMRVDDDSDEDTGWTDRDDDRVTPIGRVLRELHIDELPQLYNVLRGDMSLVGPRPERPEIVMGLLSSVPCYALRHQVKPGITGWAQICYPYADSVDSARDKLEYDLYYIKNRSLFLDLTVLFQTVQVVLWRKGSR